MKQGASSVSVVKFQGGLGNQLYQYAFVEALRRRNPRHLIKVDFSWFSLNTTRKLDLRHFRLWPTLEEAELGEIRRVFWPARSGVSRIVGYFQERVGEKKIVIEEKPGFFPDLLRVNEARYFEGYWQSYKYFEPFFNEIQSNFEIYESSISNKILELGRRVLKTKSVAIHVRRGDYASDPLALKFHGLCSLEYFLTAIELMNDLIPDAEFFVFSDDPHWVTDNLKLSAQIHLVSGNMSQSVIEDLYLMQRCHSFILSNSTLSWWAAWFSTQSHQNAKSFVIAPREWFRGISFQIDDILPPSWIRI